MNSHVSLFVNDTGELSAASICMKAFSSLRPDLVCEDLFSFVEKFLADIDFSTRSDQKQEIRNNTIKAVIYVHEGKKLLTFYEQGESKELPWNEIFSYSHHHARKTNGTHREVILLPAPCETNPTAPLTVRNQALLGELVKAFSSHKDASSWYSEG